MARRRRYVGCWICGHRARRVARGRLQAALHVKTKVVSYGPCPVMRGTIDPWPCGGVMLTRTARRLVVRAAVVAERRGYSRRSEYD